MSWVSVATTVAGFLVQQYSASQQQKKQQSLTNAMTAYKMSKAREATAATDQYLRSNDPTTREAERGQITADLRDKYATGVDAAKKFETPDNFAGKVSADYAGVRKDVTDRNTKRLNDALTQLATINAPGQRDLADARRFADAAGNVSAAGTAANNVGGAYMTGINNTRPDPYLELAGQLVSGVGTSGVLRKKPPAFDAGSV